MTVAWMMHADLAHASMMATHAAYQPSARPAGCLRFRGGSQPIDPTPGFALSDEEIAHKLNSVPTFCIESGDGVIIGTDPTAPCWYTDPEEAQSQLVALEAAFPDQDLRLVVHGLGNALTKCRGWPDAEKASSPTNWMMESTNGQSVGRLVGKPSLVEQLKPRLVEMLEKEGIDPGLWQLPIYFSADLSSEEVLPFFLNPADVGIMWTRAGGTKESPPAVGVLDIRNLVQQMRTDVQAWRTMVFISSKEAVELAKSLQ